ncbi:hypothetical protein MIR68_002455 [Amoeboaphelidium protococcarum]|nr:hypothetical protein MIR68_002455 [Amoeboaphelidium protococcarum]
MNKAKLVGSPDSTGGKTANYAESDLSVDIDIANETLFDRLIALQDIIPPHTRAQIQSSASKTLAASRTFLKFASKFAWIVTTSAIISVVPLMIAMEQEQAIVAMEQEYQLQQQGAQQMLQPQGAVPSRAQ